MNRRTLGGSLLIWGTYFAQLALLPGVGVAARHLGASEAVAGLLTAANGLGSVLGNPIGGLLVDRLGARWMLRIGLTAAVLSVALLGLPASVGGIFALLLLYGAASATLNPAVYALLGERQAGDPRRRAERLARSGVSIALASTFASPVALRVLEHGTVGTLGLVLAVAIGLPGLAGYVVLKRELALSAALPVAVGSAAEFATAVPESAERLNWAGLLVPCLAAFALIFGQGIMGLALTRKGALLGLPGWMTGAFFSAFAVATLLIFATPIARRLDRAPRLRLAGLGISLALIGLLSLAFAPSAGLIYVGMALYGLGFAIIFPVCGAMVADVSPEPVLGRAYGLFYGMFSLGGILGPILAGLLESVDPFLMGVEPMALALLMVGLQVARQRGTSTV
ncbi:MAG TPA: MFS transporter [Symbiobacteriaceae bacterium]|nr:MFS transporter [Symbiobacteriaceae bacterium]